MKANFSGLEMDIDNEVDINMEQQEFNPLRTPHEVNEADFPRTGSFQEQCRFLLRYAILAPSSYNTQPWKFSLSDYGIAVFADYTRRLPVADPGNRELLMGVGAALFNLRVAAMYFGFECRVDYNLSGDSERPLAFMSLTQQFTHPQPGLPLGDLFPAITKRRTNRNPFLLARIPESILAEFRLRSETSQASVSVSTDGALNNDVAALVALADRAQQSDPSFRRELAEWVRPNFTSKADGMTGASFGLNDLTSAVGPWATKMLNLGTLRAAKDKNLCIEAPGLIVIHSEDTVSQWIEVGELLEHLLLAITRSGLQYSFFNMPIEIPELRLQMKSLFGISSWPQLLLRIGYCLTEPAPSPRRALEEVLVETHLS